MTESAADGKAIESTEPRKKKKVATPPLSPFRLPTQPTDTPMYHCMTVRFGTHVTLPPSITHGGVLTGVTMACHDMTDEICLYWPLSASTREDGAVDVEVIAVCWCALSVVVEAIQSEFVFLRHDPHTEGEALVLYVSPYPEGTRVGVALLRRLVANRPGGERDSA